MKNKILFTLIILFIPFLVSAKTDKVDLYLFHSETCSHCQAEIAFLKTLDDVNVHLYETTRDKKNSELLVKVKKKLEVNSPYVPFTVIGSKAFIGYNDTIKDLIIDSVDELKGKEYRDVVGEIIKTKKVREDLKIEGIVIDANSLNIPILGNINPKKVSIPLLAIIIGFVDGFNPCAMWVLIFLISMLIGMKNKKRMWILGVTFLLTSCIVYLFFMMAWLKITIQISSIFIVRLLIALVALIGGIINIRSYFKSSDGCEVTTKEKRQKIFTKIKNFTSSKSLIFALIGVITLAFSVNLIELACSAGLPLIFTQILALNNITGFLSFIYCLLYIVFFLLDDLIVFIIAMVTLNVTGISTRYTKYSHLIGGIIMIIIALLLVLKPSLLMFNF